MYLSSENIKVFPTSRRNDNFDRNARLFSEYNITSIVNRLTSRDSFVVEGLDVTGDLQSISISSGCCNLAGYYFKTISRIDIAMSNLSTSLPKIPVLCLQIALKDGDVVTYNNNTLNFRELDGYDDNHNNYSGLGLIVENGDIDGEDNPYRSSNGSVYTLPIARWNSATENWDNISNSRLKYLYSDMFVDVKEGLINEGKVLEDTGKVVSRGQQSLKEWMDNLVIDDGEID